MGKLDDEKALRHFVLSYKNKNKEIEKKGNGIPEDNIMISFLIEAWQTFTAILK